MIANLVLSLLSSPAREKLLYLDPGSGSFILQLVLATLLGAAFIVKTYWQKIVAFFRNRGSRQNSEDEK